MPSEDGSAELGQLWAFGNTRAKSRRAGSNYNRRTHKHVRSGQKQKSARLNDMSGLPLKADVTRIDRHVR